jgi:hypothetical protein
MPITKASSSAVAPGAKGELVVGNATNDSGIVAVGANGTVLTADSAEATGVKWATPSSGVTTWTNRLSTNSQVEFNQIAYNGSNLYVAVGSNGALYSSPDGITWTSRTSGFGANEIQDVAFANSLWVAVGVNGTLTTSTDGITWTARTSNMSTNTIRNVVYANSLWVAVGSGGGTTNTGGIIYSSDGITWTRKSQSVNVGTTYYSVAWNGTNWIVGASFSTNNFLYASTPSGTWTVGATAANGTIQWIVWDGTRHTFGDSTDFYFSTSTTLATQTISGGTPAVTSTIKLTKLYSGNVYTFNQGWIQSFNTTSTQYGSTLSTPIITPALALQNTTPYFSGQNRCMSIFAAGYIIGTTTGKIYTSF